MDCLEAIHARTGVMAYRPEPLEPALVELVLEAAIAAPSPANLQPWAFVAVTDPALTRRVAEYLLEVQERCVFQDFLGLEPGSAARYMKLYEEFVQAPCFILVCLEDRAGFALPEHRSVLREWCLMSLGAATGNLMAAARSLGLGTRWFGGLALDEGGRALKELLSIPASVEIAAVTPLGYPAGEAPPRQRPEQSPEEISALRRGDPSALAHLLKGRLPLRKVLHENHWNPQPDP